jgi:hypothetical protein
MKVNKTAIKSGIAAGGIAAAGVFTAATALAAPPNIQPFGASEPLIDGALVTNYTGQNYRVLDKVQAPGSLNPAPIPQGSESTGTLYFDVTGAPPNGVVYNDLTQDILIWTSNMSEGSAPGAPNPSPAPGAPPSPAHT